MSNKVKVYGTKACGSALVEAFLVWKKIPYSRKEIDYTKPSKAFLRLNPLGQVPTLVMKDGSVMTESLGVANFLGLIPKTKRQEFFRWSTYLVAAIYPTFTYGDDTSQFVSGGKAQKELRLATDEARKKMWLTFESECDTPFFLGREMSVIDIYIFVMSFWRPGQDWFKENTPKLWAVRQCVARDKRFAKVWRFNFGTAL